jgi:hypothetical protein
MKLDFHGPLPEQQYAAPAMEIQPSDCSKYLANLR